MDELVKRIRLIGGWPANSPDLNPIEMIWAVMKHILNARRAKNKAEFTEVVREVWDALDQEQVIDKLVDSYSGGLEAVKRQGGKSIQPWLDGNSGGILARVNDDALPKPALWSEQEDTKVMELWRRKQNRWKWISEQMTRWAAKRADQQGAAVVLYDSVTVKQRVKFLTVAFAELDEDEEDGSEGDSDEEAEHGSEAEDPEASGGESEDAGDEAVDDGDDQEEDGGTPEDELPLEAPVPLLPGPLPLSRPHMLAFSRRDVNLLMSYGDHNEVISGTATRSREVGSRKTGMRPEIGGRSSSQTVLSLNSCAWSWRRAKSFGCPRRATSGTT
jgi:hypothetical protein